MIKDTRRNRKLLSTLGKVSDRLFRTVITHLLVMNDSTATQLEKILCLEGYEKEEAE